MLLKLWEALSKFSKGCIDFLIHLYTDVDLDKKLDANNNIIAFEDKLYDITLNEYRDITPQDYITKTCKRPAPTGEHLEKQQRIKDILFSIFENNEVVNYWLKLLVLLYLLINMKTFVHFQEEEAMERG